MTTYQFDEQLQKGEEYERQIDALFAPGWIITPATPDEQRRGIDRHFTSRETGWQCTVEYKGDNRARDTDNAFIEITSVDTRDKPGWAYTSEATYLFYYLPGFILYAITLRKLRRRLPEWIEKYPQGKAWNNGYRTIGVLVPLAELERHARVKINL